MPIALPPSANAAREPFGGESGSLIRAFDWTSAGMPRLQDWPQSLRTVVDIMMTSPVPMVVLWGERGILIYNDGYARIAGARHPGVLGMGALEAWPEAADWNRDVMRKVWAGETLTARDQHFSLARNGAPEDVWLDVSYSPVFNEQADPAGVLAVVVETTERVLLDRRSEAERASVASLNRTLEAERNSLRRLFEHAPGFMAVLREPHHRFEMANASYTRLVGGRDVVGKSVAEALPEVVEQGFVTLLDQVYGSGEPFVGRNVEVSLQGADGVLEQRFVDFVYQPVRDDQGMVEGVFVQGHDVTEAHLAFAALQESEQRFRLTADSAPAPMWVSRPDRRREFVNKAYVAFAGGDYDQALALDWRDILHPEDTDRIVRESVEGEASRNPFSLEGRFRRGDGQWRWLRSTSQPRWGTDGELAGFVGVAFDVTEEKQAAEHQRLLINELNHRVKNTLATVQSLAAQSLRGDDPTEGLRRFERRLLALSKAHDVLTRENWEGADLREVVIQALRPWREGREERFRLSGPSVRLEPRTALAVAMTLHELGTNAVKYGALSLDAGMVEVDWNVDDQAFALSWAERGGPPVSAPDRRGFGTRLIERQLAHELEGEARFDFRSEGLVCTLRAPLPLRAAPLAG